MKLKKITTDLNDNKNKRKHPGKKVFIKNPKISYLNISSNFIFYEEAFFRQLSQYKDRNLVKFTKEEEYFLKMNIDEKILQIL